MIATFYCMLLNMYMNIFTHVTANLYCAIIYLFKVNNRNTRKKYEIFPKLTIKRPERHV